MKHLPGSMAQTCSSTSHQDLSQGMERSQIQAHRLFVQQDGSILAQAMSRHRAMPADSWTKQLRNVESPRRNETAVIAHCDCHQLSSVLSRTLLSMERVASQVMKTILTICGL